MQEHEGDVREGVSQGGRGEGRQAGAGCYRLWHVRWWCKIHCGWAVVQRAVQTELEEPGGGGGGAVTES